MIGGGGFFTHRFGTLGLIKIGARGRNRIPLLGLLRRQCRALAQARSGSRAGVAGLNAVARCPVLLDAFTRVFVCLVAPNDTACTSPQQTVMTGEVPRHPGRPLHPLGSPQSVRCGSQPSG
jgi:hypothetical protein